MGFGFSRLCRPAIQFADREQALGPEVIGLGLQGFVEMPFGLKQIAAFVALEATQEVVECAVRVDLLGRRSLFLCPVEIAGPLQAGRAFQVVSMSGLAGKPRRAFKNLEAQRGPAQKQFRREGVQRWRPPVPSTSRNSHGQPLLARGR